MRGNEQVEGGVGRGERERRVVVKGHVLWGVLWGGIVEIGEGGGTGTSHETNPLNNHRCHVYVSTTGGTGNVVHTMRYRYRYDRMEAQYLLKPDPRSPHLN